MADGAYAMCEIGEGEQSVSGCGYLEPCRRCTSHASNVVCDCDNFGGIAGSVQPPKTGRRR